MKIKESKVYSVLVADDDPDDKILVKEAFEESFTGIDIHFVENGEELISFLSGEGKYQPSTDDDFKIPDLILLDLNMPRKDGRETLREIKAHPVYRSIPVVVFTTSKSEMDLIKCYQLGANSFITKPVTYVELLDVVKALGSYWFNTVMLFPQIPAEK